MRVGEVSKTSILLEKKDFFRFETLGDQTNSLHIPYVSDWAEGKEERKGKGKIGECQRRFSLSS